MNLGDRLKNLAELSKYRVENKNLAGDPLDTPKLVNAGKPKKQLAKIIEMDKEDLFPNEEQDDSAS